MYVDFSDISNKARVWIYPASRKLSDIEISFISDAAKTFCNAWTAHNHLLLASYIILNKQFVVLAVDESANEASGCSIDKSVHFIKSLEERLGIELTDHGKIALTTAHDFIRVSLKELKEGLNIGRFRPDTLVANTLVTTKEELESKWLLPIEHSIYAKFLVKAV